MEQSRIKTELLQRRRQALELRQAGSKLHEISSTLGVSIQQVRKDIAAALKDEEEESSEDQLHISLKALDRLFRISYQKALKGDLKATELALKITDRRVALIGKLSESAVEKVPERVSPVDELRARREAREKKKA